MKKVLSMILAVMMLVSLTTLAITSVSAAETAYFSKGEGTESAPYEIASKDDFKALADFVKDGKTTEGVFFKQTADIDFAAAEITPVGDGASFKGTYDGAGYKLSSYKIVASIAVTDTNYPCAALFTQIAGATIKNVNVVGAKVELTTAGNDSVAAIVGRATSGSKISACTVDATSVITGTANVGGIVGLLDGSTVEYCTNSAAVSSANSTGNNSAGGIVGFTAGTTSVKYCVNNGAVTLTYPEGSSNTILNAGGILGYANGTPVDYCVNNGAVTGINNINKNRLCVGGVVGRYRTTKGTTSNSYNTGVITATSTSEATINAGLIVGHSNASGSKADKCYALAQGEMLVVGTALTATDCGTKDATALKALTDVIDAEIAKVTVVPAPPAVDDGNDGNTNDDASNNNSNNAGNNGTTETKAPETTAAPAATEAQTEAEKGGCGSVVGTAVALVALTAVGAVALSKKKED